MPHQWNEVVAEMLEVAPELAHAFESIRYSWHHGGAYWQDITEADLEQFLAVKGPLPLYDPNDVEDEPGHYIFFESMLRPYISTLAGNPTNASRLHPIMQWVEELANSDDWLVSNLVEIALCESFLCEEESKTNINTIFPFMGKMTRQMCVKLMPGFRVSAKTKKLFGVK